ncbi:MAG: ABC transporter permease [Gemmatimonadales bacterium]|nr:MAG: ABC transporter permease [Gemmatimonadales bacterium]
MRTVMVLCAREYTQRVRTKGFVIGTVAGPLLILALILIPGFFSARSAMAERELLLVDRSGELAEAVSPRVREAGFSVSQPPAGEEDEAIRKALAGEGPGVLELDGATLDRGHARFHGADPPSTLRRLALRQAVTQSALERRLDEGMDDGFTALVRGGELEVIRPEAVEDDDGLREAAGMVTGFVGAFFLYFVLLVYGSMVLRSVLEEKSGRIAEVILSAVRPWQLMLAKIVGVGAVGLTQLVVWVGSGALLLALGVPAMLPFMGDADLSGLAEFLPSAWVVAYFFLSFLLGYFIFSSLYAAVGAMCSTEEEAQQLQFPVLMLVIVPVVFLFPILESPDATWARGLSLFPFFSPILMFGRVALGGVPLWESVGALVLMALTVGATAWVAGRIYRTGILMQGKRPTVPEIWRWVREG